LVEITQSAADPIRRSRRLGRNAVPFSPYRQRKGLGYDKQRRSNQVARVTAKSNSKSLNLFSPSAKLCMAASSTSGSQTID
jgi:hypothetical protein